MDSLAAGQSVGPNMNVTRAAGNQYETSVAINPKDNNQIFIVARNEVGGLYTARSSDGGVTWTSRLFARVNLPQPGDVPRAYGNASAAWDDLGNLFLVYLAQGTVNSAATYVTLAVSTDGGGSFYSPTGIGSAIILPGQIPYLIGDQPTVTVGPGSAGFPGSVWVTYFTRGGIWVSEAGVSGLGIVGTFSSSPLPSQPAGVSFGDIAVGPNGEAMVTYGPDSGASGTLYTNVDPDGLGPAPFSTYTAVVSTNVGGFSYIPAQPNWGIDPEAGLAYDRSNGPHRGRVYLVYTDAPSVGSADTNIFAAYSDDRGAAWSAPVRVNDDTGADSQFLPHVSLDPSTGMLAVTWYDTRNSSANDTAQYFGAFSTDGGATFTPNLQISTGTSDQANSVAALKKADYGDYTGNAFVNGRLVPAWADNSNSTGDNPDGATNFDVYTAIVQAPISLPPVVAVSFPAPDATGWYNHSPVVGVVTANSSDTTVVAITCSGGIVGNVSGLGTSAASGDVTVAIEGNNTVSCTATDSAGNTATSAVVTLLIDSIAPVLAPTLSSSAVPLLLNAVVSASPNAVDTGSGVETAACGGVDTSSAGAKSLSCEASDNAGNIGVAHVDYVVGYAISNLRLDPNTPIHAGSELEVKFQLTDANGQVISNSLARNLRCSVTVRLGTATPVCARYNPFRQRFRAEVETSPRLKAGNYPLTIRIVQGGATLGTATQWVTVKKKKWR